MMNKQRYTAQLDRVKASEAFKRETRRLMLAAATAGEGPPPAKRPVRRYTRYIATAAACLLLAVALGAAGLNLAPFLSGLGPAGGGAMDNEAAAGIAGAPEEGSFGDGGPEVASSSASSMASAQADDSLPKLQLGPLQVGGMGFEGYMLYDFAEFGANSIWAPENGQLQSMPVYQNMAQTDTAGLVLEGQGYSEDEMAALGQWAAQAIGVQVDSFKSRVEEVGKAPPDGGTEAVISEILYSVEGAFEGGGIQVQPDGDIRVFWDNGYPGGDTALEAPHDDAPREEHLAFVQRIIDSLYGLFDYMENPAPDATKEYNIYGDAMWNYYVYDAADGTAQQILHRWVDMASLAVNEDGLFYNVWIYRRDLSGYIADYPVISANEALDQVAAGGGLTTAPSAFPGAESVAAVDLVYYATSQSDVFMPYYKVYALLDAEFAGLPESSPDALNTYGVWYYPAVAPEYLDILPEAEIYFN